MQNTPTNTQRIHVMPIYKKKHIKFGTNRPPYSQTQVKTAVICNADDF